MKLNYKATNKDGKISQGVIEAKDSQEAAYYLRSRDLLPIKITQVQESGFSFLPSLKTTSNSDLILFTRQLSSMLTSGLTLMQALSILKDQMQNQIMKEIVIVVIQDVQEGKSLSASLERYPQVFSPIYVSLIRAVENSGFLDKILLRLADNLEKDQKLQSTVRSALMYPVVIVILMVIVMSIMMIFIVPQLTNLYKNLNIPLPITTQIVVSISTFMSTFWPLVLGGVILGFFLYRRWVKTESGKLIRDNLVFKVSVLVILNEKIILTEFSCTFGLLIVSV